MSHDDQPRFARREVVRMLAAAAVAPVLLPGCGTTSAPPARLLPRSGPSGSPTDPDLLNPVAPWALTLTREELLSLAALCDMIIPADEHSPAASTVGAHEFIDEWISAPYAPMRDDAPLIRDGIAWLDAEANRRFGTRFRELDEHDKTLLCDDICYLPDAPPGMEPGAHFFNKVRDLAAMAFYTTPAGMKDIGYMGNVPLDEWLPPPPEALRHVGLLPGDDAHG